jgi:hypothetical protein
MLLNRRDSFPYIRFHKRVIGIAIPPRRLQKYNRPQIVESPQMKWLLYPMPIASCFTLSGAFRPSA